MHAIRLVAASSSAALQTSGADIQDNASWAHAAPRLSVVIPTFRYDCSELVARLGRLSRETEIIVHDDGSCDEALTASLVRTARGLDIPVRIVAARRNRGRAGARNAAVRHARADWVLLLDSDMMPDRDDFLGAYLDAARRADGPCLIAGGYSLDQTPVRPGQALARWQALSSECLPASMRNRSAGRYVFSSNMLVHRAVLQACPFDEGFSGWGWEDTEWGLRVAALFPVVHIDNTASHLGVDTDDDLMAKYARSGGNFAKLVERHPEAMANAPLLRAMRAARRLPLRKTMTRAAEAAARGQFPLPVRAAALKAWRALVYADHP